jgi:hypothetical protein
MTKEIPWKHGELLFEKKGGNIKITAPVDCLDKSSGDVRVVLSYEVSPDFKKGTVNQFLKAHESESAAIKIGTTIISEMAEKLKGKGYSVECSSGAVIAFRGGAGCLGIDINIGGKRDKVEGLNEAIQAAYDGVLRENKPIAAYMSKTKDAQLQR